MSKLLFFIGILLLVFSCNDKIAYKNVNKVKINFVNKDILTIFSVGCNDFETLFQGTYRTEILTNKAEIDSLRKCINEFSYYSDTLSIDTRVKVYLYSNENLISVICFDGLGNLEIDNRKTQNNLCFVEYISKKIE